MAYVSYVSSGKKFNFILGKRERFRHLECDRDHEVENNILLYYVMTRSTLHCGKLISFVDEN